MIDIEIGNKVEQCLKRRVPDKQTLTEQLAAWEERRNAEGGTIDWMFGVNNAREKMRRSYPVNSAVKRY